jgi:hypothetical protein
LAAEQDRWVALAERSPFRSWRSQLAAPADLWDGGFDPDRERARNRLRLSPCGDAVAISGELVGPMAVAFVQQFEAKTDELFRQVVADHAECPDVAVPERPTLRAEALGELTRCGSTHRPVRHQRPRRRCRPGHRGTAT